MPNLQKASMTYILPFPKVSPHAPTLKITWFVKGVWYTAVSGDFITWSTFMTATHKLKESDGYCRWIVFFFRFIHYIWSTIFIHWKKSYYIQPSFWFVGLPQLNCRRRKSNIQFRILISHKLVKLDTFKVYVVIFLDFKVLFISLFGEIFWSELGALLWFCLLFQLFLEV